MIPWKWLWFWTSLLAIITAVFFPLVVPGDGRPMPAMREPLSPAGAVVRSSSEPASSPAAVTPSATAPYALERGFYIPAPWYGDSPPQFDAPAFTSTEIGDVTGDGRMDVIAVGSGVAAVAYNQLLVYAQQPDGTLAQAARYPILTDTAPHTALGDFNEDGVMDVVVTGMKQFVLFKSDAHGGFTSHLQAIYDPVELMTLTPPLPLDVNLDGHLDLVFFLSRTYVGSSTPQTHSRLVVWFGDGLGGFAGRYSTVTFGSDNHDVETAVSVAAGDLDQDGIVDVAVRVTQFDYRMQAQRRLVRIYLNDGQGRLAPAYDINAVMAVGANYSALEHIAIGDFNSDGRNDLAGSPASMDQRVWILHQSSSGRFDLPPEVRTSQPIGRALEVADLDNNGEDDLLIAHDGWARVTYHLQTTQHLPGPVMLEFLFNGAPRIGATGLAIGDINGDGCADAAIAASYSGLHLLRGTHCGVRPVALAVCRTQEAWGIASGSSPRMDVSPVLQAGVGLPGQVPGSTQGDGRSVVRHAGKMPASAPRSGRARNH